MIAPLTNAYKSCVVKENTQALFDMEAMADSDFCFHDTLHSDGVDAVECFTSDIQYLRGRKKIHGICGCAVWPLQSLIIGKNEFGQKF